MLEGYDEKVETRLLETIDWRSDGYRLFTISVFDESSGDCWTDLISESNSLFMSRALWAELDGFCTLFEAPGGGYVNLDTWRRACALPGVMPVVLLGEATFHQFHGGVATNAPEESIAPMHAEYLRLRGFPYESPACVLQFWGAFDPTHGSIEPSELRVPVAAVVWRVHQRLSQWRALKRSAVRRVMAPVRAIARLLTLDRQQGLTLPVTDLPSSVMAAHSAAPLARPLRALSTRLRRIRLRCSATIR